IDGARQRNFQDRLAARPAVLRIVEGPLDVVERWADMDGTAVMRRNAFGSKARKLRRLRESDIDLRRSRGVVDLRHCRAKFRRQLSRLQQSLECLMRVDARR